MMVECPKCGFVQPKDRYCANCGVDIEHFTPKSPPLFSRLIKNTSFQIAVGVFILAGTLAYLFSGRDIDFDESIEEGYRQTLVERNTLEPRADERENESADFEQENPEPDNEMAAGEDIDAEEQSPDSPAIPQQLTLRIIEVSSASLNAFIDSPNTRIITDGALGIIGFQFPDQASDLSQFLEPTQTISFSQSFPLPTEEPVTKDWLYQDAAGESYGISIVLTTRQVSASQLELGFEGFVRLKGNQSIPGFEFSFNESIQLKPLESAFISRAIPQTELIPEADNSPFSILKSQDFIENNTKALIVIRPRTE